MMIFRSLNLDYHNHSEIQRLNLALAFYPRGFGADFNKRNILDCMFLFDVALFINQPFQKTAFVSSHAKV